MAFNPLRSLRKHQKVFMAGMVFVAMFTFILFSGAQSGADFFGWLQNTFFSGRSGTEVATLHGESVSAQEFLRLRQQRMLAHQYMTNANTAAIMEVQKRIKQLDEEAKKKLGDTASVTEKFKLNGELTQLQQRQPQQNQHYFGGPLGEVFDFLIWRKQADRLGIHLTEADVRKERNLETIQPLSPMMLKSVELDMTRRGEALNPTLLVTALADEFRVRLAKAALLGADPPAPRQGFGQAPPRLATSFTPDEFWEFYRKMHTKISVRMLPIPARELLPLVKETPTEDELKALFDKYKETEPNPALPTPGFKQPRRVQVDWVSVSANEEPYPRVADISLAILEATMPLVFQDQLLTEYAREKLSRFRLPGWGEEQSGKALLPALKQPDYENALRWRGLGLSSVQGAVLNAVLGSYQAREVAQDLKDLGPWVEEETKTRQRFLATTLALAGTPCAPLMLTGVPALGVAARQHAGDQFGQHLPLHTVKRYLFKALRDTAARYLVQDNLTTFRKELESRRNRPEELKKYVAESLTKYGMKSGGMAQPRDRYTVMQDPSIQPLRNELKDRYRMMAQFGQFQGARELAAELDDDPHGRMLGGFLFSDPSLTRTFAPQQTFRGEPTYLYWLSYDKAAYAPRYEEVKDQVVEAWRLTKARELAKKEAEKVAEDAKKAGQDAQRVLMDGSPHSGKLLQIYDVTRLNAPLTNPLAGRGVQYTPYRLPRGEIEFPTPDLPDKPGFLDKILGMKDLGDVVVLHDNPETTYYVVTPMSRRFEPLPGEFQAVYKKSTAMFDADPLINIFDYERRGKQLDEVTKQLRAEAKFKPNEENLKMVVERPGD